MRWWAAAMAAATLAGCSPRDPQVRNAWVRLPAVPGRPGAAYFTVRGGGPDARLTRVATPAAARAELHESMAAGMRAIPGVPVPGGAEVAFAPGGRHVMLFGLRPGLKPGDTVPLQVVFDRGRVTVDAAVLGAADPAP